MGLYGLIRLLDDSNTPSEQGAWGEQIVNAILYAFFQKEDKAIYKDFYIESNGYVYQLDHIFVYKTGIFVIETKMMSGRIYGSIDDDIWKSVTPSKTITFYNPIKQNESHIKALKGVLGDYFPIESIIALPNDKKPKGCPLNVVNKKELVNYIKCFNTNKPLSHEDITHIKGLLDAINNKKKELKQKHIKQIIDKKTKK